MTAGALLFAFDSDSINYTKLAAWSADRIHRHLSLPVCLVTDRDPGAVPDVFDHVVTVSRPAASRRYFDDLQHTVDWFNQDRCDAMQHTPFDRTLVLDVDYVVNSDQLLCLFDAPTDFLCHETAIDVKTGCAFNPCFGQYRLPMSWATVMMFRRSTTAEMIFSVMHMVQQNWQHYRDLYGIDRSAYRNDHALSIARLLANGHWIGHASIPWHLASVLPGDKLECDSDNDSWRINFSANHRPRWIRIQGQDFHAMGKTFLEAAIDDQG
jgi:hypothetical protein